MESFEKIYIGKGTQVENLEIVKVVIPVENLEQAMFYSNGKKYLSFEVAKLREVTKFGKTHTCYFNKKVTVQNQETEAPTPEVKPKRKIIRKKSAESEKA